MNQYDELLRGLAQSEQNGAGPAPVNPYDEIIRQTQVGGEQRLRQTVIGAEGESPERAAQAARMSRVTGVPVEVVRRNFDTMRRAYDVENMPYEQVLQSPALAEFMSERPTNAALVSDDLENLSFLEWVTRAPQRAFSRNVALIELSKLRFLSMQRELTADERTAMDAWKRETTSGGDLGAGNSLVRKAITGGAGLLPMIGGSVLAGLQRGIPFGVTAGTAAAMAGQLGPQVAVPEEAITVPVAFAGGMGAGMLTGASEFGFALEAGLAYDEFLEYHDEAGARIDPVAAKAAALGAGALSAGFEAFGLGALLRNIPGVNKVMGAAARKSVGAALKNPTVRAALVDAMKAYGEVLTAETSVEVAQRAAVILAGEMAKQQSGLETQGAGEIAGELASEAGEAALAFSLIPLPGASMQVARDARRAQAAQAQSAFFEALATGVRSSKTVQRMPEAAQAILARATAGGPVEQVHIDAEQWRTYWQEQGMDPAEVAAEVTGSRDAYEQALETQGDLVIPTAAYAVRLAGTDHHAGLAPDLRLDPEAMSPRERDAWLAEQADLERQAAAEQEALAGAPDPAEGIRQQIEAELVGAGVPADVARKYASLDSAFFVQMATTAGVDPMALYERYGLRVTREGTTGAAGVRTGVEAALAGDAGGGVEINTPGRLLAALEAVEGEAGPDGLVPLPAALTPDQVESLRAMGAVVDVDGPDGTVTGFRPEAVAALRAEAEAATVGADGAAAGAGGRDAGTGDDVRSRLGEHVEAAAVRSDAERRRSARLRSRGVEEVPASYADRFQSLLAAAREQGFVGSDDQLATIFNEYLTDAEQVVRDTTPESDDLTSGRELLLAISSLGGINIEAETGLKGELASLFDSLSKPAKSEVVIKRGKNAGTTRRNTLKVRSAGLPGIPRIVTREGGLTADLMLSSLQQEARWENLFDGDLSTFMEAVDKAVRGELEAADRKRTGLGSQPVDQVEAALSDLLRVRTDESAWWQNAMFDPVTGESIFLQPVDDEATLEILDPDSATLNASGESSASLEALRRQAAMTARGEQFVVYDRLGMRRPLFGPDAVDYVVRQGETYGIEGPMGFRVLDDMGGRHPGKTRVFNQGVEDYGGDHRPPGPADGAPLHDLTGAGTVYPDDVYGPNAVRFYGTGDAALDRVSFAIVGRMKDAPSKRVPIYRAVPKGMASATINRGDWVTINRKYAEQHGERFEEGYEILSTSARADELFTNGDSIHEWGFWPASQPNLVADAAGNPLTMFHGTNQQFDVFELNHETDGIYFSSNEQYAAGYGKVRAEMAPGTTARVVPVRLRMSKPLELDGQDAAVVEQYQSRGFNRQELIAQGYDGIVLRHADGEVEAMVLDPAQVVPLTEFNQTAFHGSPHRFERFSTDAIGSGEGAQVYGWGLYFASRKEVAEWYRTTLTRQRGQHQTPASLKFDGEDAYDMAMRLNDPGFVLEGVDADGRERLMEGIVRLMSDVELGYIQPWISNRPLGESVLEHLARAQADAENELDFPIRQARREELEGELASIANARAAWARFGSQMSIERGGDRPGRTFKVEVPEPDVMLDWDSSSQPEVVQQALRELGVWWEVSDFEAMSDQDLARRLRVALAEAVDRDSLPDALLNELQTIDNVARMLAAPNTGESSAELRGRWRTEMRDWLKKNGEWIAPLMNPSGERLYGDLVNRLGSAREASIALASKGVPGLRYLDGMSRGRGEGQHNFVIFDEEAVNVLEFEQAFFHGTPHKVDRFSLSRVGTGEGAAAFGWGLYFAEDPEVAGSYRDSLGKDVVEVDGVPVEMGVSSAQSWAVSVVEAGGSVEAGLARIAEMVDEGLIRQGSAGHRGVLEAVEALRGKTITRRNTGRLYQVDIADDAVERMMDGDAPLAKQPKALQEAVRAAFKKLGYLRPNDNGPRVLTAAFKSWRMEHGRGWSLSGGASHGDNGHAAYAVISQSVGGDEQASRLLAAMGIPGLLYRDGNTRGTRKRPKRNVVVFDDSVVSITHEDGKPVTSSERVQILTELHQGTTGSTSTQPVDRRGFLRFGPDRQMNIGLTSKANLSTFLHESGHLFLEVFGDVVDQVVGLAPEALSDPQRKLLADYGALLQWLGVERREDITVEHHEKFARAFEAYLMEGKAPSLSLRDIFVSFRAWLLGVYRQLRNLNVELTDEVRSVFDRMLASEEAIAEAKAQGNVEAMFLTADQAGMSEAEFAAYQDRVSAATRIERETVEQRLLAEVQRERESAWREQRAAIRASVFADLSNRQVYRALAAIRKGVTPEGQALVEGEEPKPLKLSKAELVRRYGADFVKTMPRPHIYTSGQDGVPVDTVAEMFGFSSGDELLLAIREAPALNDLVERETDRRMLAEHGSMLLDGTIEDHARAALAGEAREQVIRAELRMLRRLERQSRPAVEAALAEIERERAYERRWFEAETKLMVAIAEGAKQAEIDRLRAELSVERAKARSGAVRVREAIPDEATIHEMAKTRVRYMRVRDLKPQRFWSAARKASRRATEAAARQDFAEAAKAKTAELVNMALYREVVRVREDVSTKARRVQELASKEAQQRLGLAGESYQDQVNGILDRYSFAAVSQKSLDRRASLAKWIAAQEAEGVSVQLPEELLEEQRRTPFQELSVETFLGVVAGVDHIVHLARLKNKLLKAQQDRELSEIRASIVESIHEHAGDRRSRSRDSRDRSPIAERLRMIGGWFGSHRKMASLARQMDGDKAGPLWEYVIRPMNEAADREAVMNAQATERLDALFSVAFPGREMADLYTRQFVPAVGRSLSRMERIVVALNWGNEGNRDRIRRGEKWSDAQVEAVLNTLSESDWRFVQGVWDFLGSYWSEIEAKQQRVTGVAPEAVLPSPYTTRFGFAVTGGYYPLKYDERISASAAANLEITAAQAQLQAAYVQATTQRGHTEARRQTVSMPVRLDFGVIFEHVTQVVHDLSHHEMLIDVGRVLSKDVRQAILDRYGDSVYRQFADGIRDVAFGDVPARHEVEASLNYLRQGATVAGLGWNMMTAFLQPLGLTQSMARIGVKWVALGGMRWLRGAVAMEGTVAAIYEKSSFMRLRGKTLNREVNEIRNTIVDRTGAVSGWVDEVLRTTSFNMVTKRAVADSFFYFIQQLQKVADVPTWLGAYEKAIAGGASEADAVAQADQAVIDSQGSGMVKDLARVQRGGPALKLWTNFYSFFNVTYNQFAESLARTSPRDPASVGRLAVDYLLLFTLPASLGYLMREVVRGSLGDDDEPMWLALARENASYMTGTMIGVREMSGAIQGFMGYEGPAGARAFATLSRFGQQASQGEFDEAFWRSLNDSGGVLFHYPSGQVWRTLTGIKALVEGKTQNPAAAVFGAPRE